MSEPNRNAPVVQMVEQATFTSTLIPGLEFPLATCDVCGALVARQELHERWHRQFTHAVELAVWVDPRT